MKLRHRKCELTVAAIAEGMRDAEFSFEASIPDPRQNPEEEFSDLEAARDSCLEKAWCAPLRETYRAMAPDG